MYKYIYMCVCVYVCTLINISVWIYICMFYSFQSSMISERKRNDQWGWVKASTCNAEDASSAPGFDTWVGKIPWRRKRQPTPVLLPGKFHGLRSLVDYSLWGHKESDMTEPLHFTAFQTLVDYEGSLYTWVFLFKIIASLRNKYITTLNLHKFFGKICKR